MNYEFGNKYILPSPLFQTLNNTPLRILDFGGAGGSESTGQSAISYENIYVTDFSSNYVIGNTPQVTNIFNNVDANKIGWITQISPVSPKMFSRISVLNNDVYVSGTSTTNPIIGYNGPIGNIIGITGTVLSNNNDAYIFKYSSGGIAKWMGRVSASGVEIGYGVSANLDGVYFTCNSNSNPILVYNGSTGGVVGITGTGSGNQDGILVKYSSGGTAQWMARVSTIGSDTSFGVSSFLDNVYISGFVTGSQILIYNGPTASVVGITGTGLGSDAFIVKYSAGGTAQWLARVSSSGSDYAYGLSATSDSVYASGFSNGNPILAYNGPTGAQVGITGTGSANEDVFIVKYSSGGTAEWIGRVSTSGTDRTYDLFSTPDSVYLSGYSTGNPILVYNGPTADIVGITGTGSTNNDAFIVKYSSAGTAQWLARVSSINGNIQSYGVTVTSDGIYMTGYGTGNQILVYNGPTGAQVGITGIAFANDDAFIVKYSSDGIAQWLGRIYSANTEQGFGISSSLDGIYISGYSNGNPLVYSGPNGSTVSMNTSSNSNYILKVNSNGQIFPIINLTPNNTKISPTNKYITYKTLTPAGIQIKPTTSMGDPSVGSVSNLISTQNFSNLSLLYDPQSGTDWFIQSKNGFTI